MAEEPQDSAEKEHEPSGKRLDDARRQGDVARSNDLNTGASYIGLLIACLVAAPLFREAGSTAMTLIDAAPTIARGTTGRTAPFLHGLALAAILPVAVVLAGPAVAVLVSTAAQRGFSFAPAKLRPKLSRISPLSIARQKFGPDGLVEFAKGAVKLGLASVALFWFLSTNLEALLVAPSLDPAIGVVLMVKLLGRFLLIAALVAGAIGAVDLVWQHHALHRRNRMTRKEMLDEMKDSEGDPQAKATRRQRGQDMAMNQMLSEVATASVVIVNPTHYAVALRWTRSDRSAPIVVAKGVDGVALRIRDAARAAGVPIHSDPPTARAIHATRKIGEPIDRDHYKAVAAAIRFAERMRAKAGRRIG